MYALARRVRGAQNRERRAVAAGCQRTRVAVGHYSSAVGDEVRSMRPDKCAAAGVVVMHIRGASFECGQSRRGICNCLDDISALVYRPEEIDRRRTP